jgi:flagellar biosynthesis protein FlhF
MQVKRFQGADIHEVLRLVKYEMGPNAVILSTRHIIRGKGTFGMFGRPAVEVTATIDREETNNENLQQEQSPRPAVDQTGLESWNSAQITQALDPLHQDMDQIKEIVQQLAVKERLSSQKNYSGLTRELNAVKQMLEHLVQNQRSLHSPLFESPLMPYYHPLLASGVEEDLARRLLESIQNSITNENLSEKRYVRGFIANCMMKSIQVSGPLRPASCSQGILAFVRPTGVGKTTTIAKLAAHFALSEKKKIALITLDTYRIAAIDQLRIFAKIINLSVDVVINKAELDQKLAKRVTNLPNGSSSQTNLPVLWQQLFTVTHSQPIIPQRQSIRAALRVACKETYNAQSS